MKILIATDGSEFGSAAVAKACEIVAGQPSSEVRILTAYEVPVPIVSAPFVPVPVYSDTIVAELRQKASQIASNAEKGLLLCCPQSNVSSEVLMDEPGAAIVSAAKAWKADMIIVGSHGHGFLGRIFLGSVSDHVVHNAPCSVLVVRNPAATAHVYHANFDAVNGLQP